MIQVKIDDTIIDIIDKIGREKSKDIILDFPLGHPILHNYISLKILKSKVGEKKLIIATNDRIGKKIGKRIGIEYSVIKDSSFLQENTREKLMEHNFTFWEYFKFQLHSYKQELKHSLDTNKKLNSLGKYSRIYQEKISIHIFLGALLLSIFIFLFIYYFAISKTYITITPEVTVKKEARNFIFKESIEDSLLGNNKFIKINNISETIHSSDVYAATEIIRDESKVSKGVVRIYNYSKNSVSLVPNTRLQNNNGIVFETPSWVTIPGSVTDNFGKITPGQKDISVMSQILDTEGRFIGKRGNILKNTDLFLPGLSKEKQTEVYSTSLEDFIGGSDDHKKSISEEDIGFAKKIFTQKIKTEVISSIKNNILLENSKNNSQLDILSGGQSILYSEPKIEIEAGVKPGDIRDSFMVSGSITAYVYTYNKTDIIQKLKTLLNTKNLASIEKISHIDNDSLRMSEIIYLNEDPFELKGTFEIEALFFHDFLHKDNTYTSLLKSEIRGLEKGNAEKILLNNSKISNVHIDIRPFFTSHISNIYNNIVFKIQ